MVDFQSGGLEFQVYELILKMCELTQSDEFPHFQTTQLDNGMWECTLEIPGIQTPAKSLQNTEVAAINRCAANMLHILKNVDEKGFYDPKIEESVFRDKLEMNFGNINYDPSYFYYMCQSEFPINPSDEYLMKYIVGRMNNKLDEIDPEGLDELVKIEPHFVTKCLLRRKKNFC